MPLLIHENPCSSDGSKHGDDSSENVEYFKYDFSCSFIEFNLKKKDDPEDYHEFDDGCCIELLDLTVYILKLDYSLDHID